MFGISSNSDSHDCNNCDYSTSTLGGRCCRFPDNDDCDNVPIRMIPSIPTPPPEKTYTESQVKLMIDQAIAKSEAKCLQYKHELIAAYEQNQKLVNLYNKSRR